MSCWANHDEQLVIASLARYHRRSLPKKRHQSWSLLDREQRRLVERLSLLLRLAVAMDRALRGQWPASRRSVMATASAFCCSQPIQPMTSALSSGACRAASQ